MRTYIRNRVPGGCFFLTLCLEDRTQQLLTDHIEAFRQASRETCAKHFFTLHGMVVLPDHIHMLIRLPENNSDCAVIVSSLKALFSRSLPRGETISPSRERKRERGIWQRRYWEHTVRDERDFANHMDYIHFNPVKHGYAAAAKDWPYFIFLHCVGQGIYPMDWGGNPEADIYTD